MPGETTRESHLSEEADRIREEERQKQTLLDRSIGGPMAPRPSQEFIRAHVGDLRSEKDILQEAERRVAARERAERSDEVRREVIDRSWTRHREAVEREKADRSGSMAERLSGLEGRERPSLTERLKEMAKGVSRKNGRGHGDD
jgi:hypothetical protein